MPERLICKEIYLELIITVFIVFETYFSFKVNKYPCIKNFHKRKNK